MDAVGVPGYTATMQKNKTRKRLYVSSESIALLTAAGLRVVAGGGSLECTTEQPGKSQCFQGCSGGACIG